MDVRVVAATNRDLSLAIGEGSFRSDLFYRLNVFPIHVPPLRKRREDIPILVEYFVKRQAPLRADGSGPLPATLQDQEKEMIEGWRRVEERWLDHVGLPSHSAFPLRL